MPDSTLPGGVSAARGLARLERRRDVPQWQVRLDVAAGLLPFGQRDVPGDERLVGDLAEQGGMPVSPRTAALAAAC